MNQSINTPDIALRPASQVMKLARMGSFHQTRLSFMRSLLRHISKGEWRFQCVTWHINDNGVGHAVYVMHGRRDYSLVCFAHDIDADKRSDRVIADQWDTTFALFDGIPSQQDILRLQQNVPKQEAGRYQQTELVLSRANRSVRLFDYIVECLSQGEQPDEKRLDQIGYLMRTTAVYGNGKFGICDREQIANREEFCTPFHAELLTVWLIRWFTIDMVNHSARCKGGQKSVELERQLCRRLGVGNSTGLGMAPFLIRHPSLIHQWMFAKESALQRIRNIMAVSDDAFAAFQNYFQRTQLLLASWEVEDVRQTKKIAALKKDMTALYEKVTNDFIQTPFAWHELVLWAEDNLTLEGQELLVTLLIESHAKLVDDLADSMAQQEQDYFHIDGNIPLSVVVDQIRQTYDWVLQIDFSQPTETARFWYVSEEKLEPRLGERYQELGGDKEQPLCYGRDIAMMYVAMMEYLQCHQDAIVADFLLSHPQHRHSVRRMQTATQLPYAEIQDNLISDEMVPIDLLRCKLSFFGASKFDPKSDRWVRVNMYQHAPFPDEIAGFRDDWIYPCL